LLISLKKINIRIKNTIKQKSLMVFFFSRSKNKGSKTWILGMGPDAKSPEEDNGLGFLMVL
jgi:hypothetical protein